MIFDVLYGVMWCGVLCLCHIVNETRVIQCEHNLLMLLLLVFLRN